ncbi:MAG: DUF3160 domain-containing protein [Deltaproteobacteria bacterium]|nr:DUF3160 domain-containing protein [Deltaproteobacteria bacterium]
MTVNATTPVKAPTHRWDKAVQLHPGLLVPGLFLILTGLPLAAFGFTYYAPSPKQPIASEKPSNFNPRVDAVFATQKRIFAKANVSKWLPQGDTNFEKMAEIQLRNVAYFDAVRTAFDFSSQMESQLSTHGFGVRPSSSEPSEYSAGFSAIYYDIYEADLPVFVTVDSVLHAFHRSFDRLMQYAEEQYVYPQMHWLLSGMLNRLNPELPAERDAMVYLAVPFKLLGDEQTYLEYDAPSNDLPTDVDGEAAALIELIYGESRAVFNFFGQSSDFDFSVFYPRGHYGETFELSQLFRAMIWLNRLPLLTLSSESGAALDRHRELARALLGAIHRPAEKRRYGAIHRFYSDLIGSDNTVDMLRLLNRCRQKSQDRCMRNSSALTDVLKEMAKSETIRDSGNGNAEVHLKFFPTKFEYTAWLTEQTTQPRLNAARTEGGRTMASPMDVAYVLGSKRAAFWLKSEITESLPAADAQQLTAALVAAQKTMQRLPPSSVADTPLSHWLEALMHASEKTSDKKLPLVLKSSMWHDHKMETVLASWTEMRHDTLLMVAGGGGSSCEFPQAYVEPIPGVYSAIFRAVQKMRHVYFSLGAEFREKTSDFLLHFGRVMHRLEQISRHELNGERMTDAELKYINGMMAMETDDYTGDRLYNGWYPRLYWMPWMDEETFSEESGIDKPLVADVFTDFSSQKVLETATGHPGIIFVILETNQQETLYVGAVSSFYYFLQDAEDRMNDADWRTALSQEPPKRPDFVQGYWVE